jgi:membrane protease YdiL (CAAX protease family)
MSDLQQALPGLLAWATQATLCGLIGGGLWLYLNRSHRSILPPQRYRLVPWGSIEMLIVLFMLFFLFPILFLGLLARTGFLTWVYGSDFPIPFLSADSETLPKTVTGRWDLWVQFFSFPLQAACIPVILRLGSGTRLYQLGLTCHRWVEDIAAACLLWLVLVPLVFGVDIVATWCFKSWLEVKPSEHVLIQLALGQPTQGELIAVITIAVVAAPIVEELLFRGMLQNWLAAQPWGGAIAFAASGGLAIVFGWKDSGFWPLAFVLLTAPGYYYLSGVSWRWLPRPDATRAVYGTSLLFAVFHSSVWPSPIALFILALGLGFLAYRTQSLLGPILLHSLFNGVTAIAIFYMPLVQDSANGKEMTSAVFRVPSLSNSSIVPAS